MFTCNSLCSPGWTGNCDATALLSACWGYRHETSNLAISLTLLGEYIPSGVSNWFSFIPKEIGEVNGIVKNE
jgi:hypothetical protein